MSIFDPTYIEYEQDTKLKSLILNRLSKSAFDSLSAPSPDEIWFIQESNLSGQPIVVDTRPGPTKLSQFQNDVPYLSTVSWYDINDRPTIPSYTSQLTNDSGFVNQSYVQQQVLEAKTKWKTWTWGSSDPYLHQPFTVRATQANSSVNIYRYGYPPSNSFEYSTDNGQTWNAYSI